MSRKRDDSQAKANAQANRYRKGVLQQRTSYIHWNFYGASPRDWPNANKASALAEVTKMAQARFPL